MVHSGSSHVTFSDGPVVGDITVDVIVGAVVLVDVVVVVDVTVVEVLVDNVVVVDVLDLVEVLVDNVVIVDVLVVVESVHGKQFSTLSLATSPGPLTQQGHVYISSHVSSR